MKQHLLGSTFGVLAFLFAAAPGGAQDEAPFRWSSARPDANGPAGLRAERTLDGLGIQFTLKAYHEAFRGMGLGKDSLTFGQVSSLYAVAPTRMLHQGTELGVQLGLGRHLTLGAAGRFARKTVELAVRDPNDVRVTWIGRTAAFGPEDVQVYALYNLYDRGGLRVHAEGGASIPLGAVDFDDDAPDPADPGNRLVEVQLPYVQQMGSGTFEFLPGITAVMQNETASLGFQARGIVRIGDNDRGWALGDEFHATGWAGYKVSEVASVSFGFRYASWGSVEGADPAIRVQDQPAYDSPLYTGLQSGSRLELPVGVNFLLPPGRFGGHRIGVEFVVPVEQRLDYVQFRKHRSLVVSWQKDVRF